MLLPASRGPVSAAMIDLLHERRHGDTVRLTTDTSVAAESGDVLTDDDLQLALWLAYELHYRGFDDVDDTMEWDPAVLALRAELEALMITALRAALPALPAEPSTEAIADRLFALVAADDGPSLSSYLDRRADRHEFEEFVIHRSVYHLKEADPHSWAIPRLGPAAKAALVAVQSDEYGNGVQAGMHSELFRATMRSLGLDDTYGTYVPVAPGVTLAISNLISLFGLHRALRGALVGHLAAFEMTSSLPNRKYSRGVRRVSDDEADSRFYDEHVTADALHEQLAAYDLCGGLVADEPHLAEDVMFGARCGLYLDRLFAEHVLASWADGQSSLRAAVQQPSVAVAS